MEVSRSLQGFHKIVSAHVVWELAVGKPPDCMVGATRSCCSPVSRVDCIAEEFAAGIAIVCEQIVVGCM